ncbi:hypothetical protein ACS0TY_024238 [Phlomoides rotata]
MMINGNLADDGSDYGSGFGGDSVTRFGMRPIKVYDEKMIVEIYESIVMAQGQLVPRDASWIGSEFFCKWVAAAPQVTELMRPIMEYGEKMIVEICERRRHHR